MKILEITKVRGHTSTAAQSRLDVTDAGVVLVREPEDGVVLPTLRTIYYGCEIEDVNAFTRPALPPELSNWYILMTDPGESGLVAIPLNTNRDVPYTVEGQSEFFRDTVAALQDSGIADDHTRRVVAIVYSLPDDELYDGFTDGQPTDTDVATSSQDRRDASNRRTGSSALVDMCLAGAWLGVVFLKDLKQLGASVLTTESSVSSAVDQLHQDLSLDREESLPDPTPVFVETNHNDMVIDITSSFENRLF